MAYTYDDFIKAADSAGMINSFSADDMGLAKKYPEYGLSLVTLKRDLGNAKTNEQQLLVNEAINQLRKNYGSYWTGDAGDRTYAASYGSKINSALDDINNYGEYKSAYTDRINDVQKSIDDYGNFNYGKEEDYKRLLDRVINQPEFTYDYETDPLFSNYKKAYLREGDRAAANAMARAAAMTGGRQSSWSDYVGQEQASYYASKLADAIPQLRAQRLNEYNNEYENLLRAFSTMGQDRSMRLSEFNNGLDNLRANLADLRAQDETEYGRYRDAYTRMQQDLAALQAQDESDYKRFLDALNAEYQRDRDAVTDAQTEFENALKIYQLTGKVTGVLADYLGVDATVQPAGASYGSYSGSASGNAPTLSDKQKQAELEQIYNDARMYDINGTKTMWFEDLNAYNRIKELTGYSDDALYKLGVRGRGSGKEISLAKAAMPQPGNTNTYTAPDVNGRLVTYAGPSAQGTISPRLKGMSEIVDPTGYLNYVNLLLDGTLAQVKAQDEARRQQEAAAAAAARIAAENAVREAAAKAAAQNGSAIHNNNGSSSSSSGSGTKAAQKANQAAKTGTSSSSSSSRSGTKAAQKANQAAKTGTSSSGQKGNGGR